MDGVEYVTDETGSAVLSADASAKAQVTVQAEKKAESGVPQVIRLAPGYTLDLTAQETPAQPVFSDVAEGLWYTPYVLDTLHKMGAKKLADPDKVCTCVLPL